MSKMFLAALVALVLLVPMNVFGQSILFDDNRSTLFLGAGGFYGGVPDLGGPQVTMGRSFSGRFDLSLIAAHDSRGQTYSSDGIGTELFLVRQHMHGFPFYVSISQTIAQTKRSLSRWQSEEKKAILYSATVAIYRRMRISDLFSAIMGFGAGRVDALDIRARTVGAVFFGVALVYQGKSESFWLNYSESHGDGIRSGSGMLGVSFTLGQ